KKTEVQMSEAHGTSPDPAWRARGGDPRATIKLLRQQLQAHCHVPKIAKDGSVIERRAVEHVVPRDLPDSLRRLLQAYQQRHPQFELEPICYLTFDAADENRALELKNLPDEEQLVVLTCTESAADISDVYVKTQTLLVRRRRKG